MCIAVSDIFISWSLQQHVYIIVDLSASVHYKSKNEFLPDISIAFLNVLRSYMSPLVHIALVCQQFHDRDQKVDKIISQWLLDLIY